jgi:hypothetical protein
MNIFSSIRAQANLPVGWHYGEGAAPGTPAIGAALELCSLLFKRGYSDSDMEDFPYSNGRVEVMLEAGLEVSFIVEDSNSIRVRFFMDGEYVLVATKATIQEAIEFVPTRECNTFATYISEISETKKAVTSEEKAFWTMTEAASPSSNWNVLIVNPEIHAITPPPSTAKSLILLPLYSSSSPTMNYPRILDSRTPLQTTRATITSRSRTKKKPTHLFVKSHIVPWDEFMPVEATERTLSI